MGKLELLEALHGVRAMLAQGCHLGGDWGQTKSGGHTLPGRVECATVSLMGAASHMRIRHEIDTMARRWDTKGIWLDSPGLHSAASATIADVFELLRKVEIHVSAKL